MYVAYPGPSPGFSIRGAKNQKGEAHFKNTVLDISSNQGAKREMGGTDFKWGGRAPLAPPAGDGPGLTAISMSLSRYITCQDVYVQQSHATKRLLP